ncbi:MAG: hypothetical protein ABIH23_27860 [bacterium]
MFQGKVVSIDYRSSSPMTPEQRPIPHTFVTFSIQEVYKGLPQNRDTITLRFRGGLREEDGKVLDVEGVPSFNVGEEGVFFVCGNGRQLCPLVGWGQGRYRIISGNIYNDVGQEVLLSDDPVLAARIHPKDLQDHRRFETLLVKGQRKADQVVWGKLSNEAQILVHDPTLQSRMDPSRLTYAPPKSLDPIAQEWAPKLMPAQFLQTPKNIQEALIFRDMNFMLLDRSLFSEADLEGIPLQPQISEILRQNRDNLPLERVLLMNRRILETVYPDVLLRSLDQTILSGQTVDLSEIRKGQIGSSIIETVHHERQEREGPPISPVPPPGKRLTLDEFGAHITNMVQVLHTPEELRALPPVADADISQEFFVRPPNPVRPRSVAPMTPPTPTDPEEQEETRLFLESGRNPVLNSQ